MKRSVFTAENIQSYFLDFHFQELISIFLTLSGIVLFCNTTYQLGLSGTRLLFYSFIGAAFSCFLLQHSQFKPVKWILLCIGAAMLVWHLWDRIAFGSVTIYHRFAETLEHAINITFPNVHLSADTELLVSEQAAAEFAACLFIFLFALLLCGTVFPTKRAWLLMLATIPWILPGILAELALDWTALSLVLCVWSGSLLTGLINQKKSGRARNQIMVSAMAATFLLVNGLRLIMPESTYIQPAWTAAVRTEIIELGIRAGELFSSAGTSAPNTWTPNAPVSPIRPETVDLSSAGPRFYTERPVFQVKSDISGNLYLKGSSFASYTGSAWEQLSETGQAQWSALVEDQNVSAVPFLPTIGATNHSPVSATIYCVNRPSEMVYYPYHLINSPHHIQDMNSLDSGLFQTDEPLWEYTVSFIQPNENPSPAALTGEIQTMEANYREFVYANYMDVPEETADYLRRWKPWAERTAESFSESAEEGTYAQKIATARHIASLLAATTEYRLDTPFTPQGWDFVTYFLDVSRQGYCMHYASAATLLLRLEGIPARYVSGYLAQGISDQIVDIPDSAAHAWVEIYLDGYGWCPVEATPSGPMNSTSAPQSPENPVEEPIQPSESEPLEEQVSQEPDSPDEPLPGDSDTADSGESESAVFLKSEYWNRILILLLCVLVLAAIRVYRWICWWGLWHNPDHSEAVLKSYRWIEDLIPWGASENSLAQDMAKKARFSQHTMSKEEHASMLFLLQNEIQQCRATLPLWKRPFFHFLFHFAKPAQKKSFQI